jgi:hypothetical protein
MGLIAMSERDLQRIETLSKVVAGRMTTVSAAHVLDLSERQVRRLLERMRTGGAASIRHKAIGRPSNNRISDEVRDYAMTLVRERYADFGPTLATEKLDVGSQLTFSFERKRIMLEETAVTRGLVGRYVETYAYADGRLDVRRPIRPPWPCEGFRRSCRGSRWWRARAGRGR